jgi:hypothetical protein
MNRFAVCPVMSGKFKLPGSDLLNPDVGPKTSSSLEEIFTKKQAGGNPKNGGIPKRKSESEPERDIWNPDPVPAEPIAEKSATENTVRLHALEWDLSEGEFSGHITASVQGEVPRDIEHITRVQFCLFALDPNGKPESIGKQEGHLKDGTAQAEFTLYYPSFRDNGALPSKCDYRFTAKHKYSDEEESKLLPVSEKEGELPDYCPGTVEGEEWACFTEIPALHPDIETIAV